VSIVCCTCMQFSTNKVFLTRSLLWWL